jgi:hypothetical protein
VQLAGLQVREVHVGDLELAARRRLEPGRDLEDAVVVEVEPGHRVVRPRLLRLLLEPDGAAARVELHDAVALGIAHAIGEDGRAALATCGVGEQCGQAVAVEDVVAEGEGHAVPAHEVASDQEGLGETFRPRLRRPRDADAELRPVSEKPAEPVLLVGRRDDEDLPDPREHQCGKRVVDHRLVVDGDELLAHAQGHGPEPGSRASCEDDALHARGG